MSLFYADEVHEARQLADVVDLFSGPRGWSEGGRLLEGDFADVGLELDRWACATSRAAGHPTVECNIAEVDPADYAGTVGLIASPPCQAFSLAGNQHGSRHLDALLEAIDARAWQARPHRDPNVWLVLEVGRWFDQLRPRWIACEQVPAVLPLWERYAELLTADGYSTWTGILNAADYGVPQTRRRAVLIASRDDPVGRPPTTHHETGADGKVPWVTMAAALGWGMTERPAFTLAAGTTSGGGRDPMMLGGSGARKKLEREHDEGRWMLNTGRDWKPGGTREDAQTIDTSTQPAPTLTGLSGGQWHLVAGAQDNATRRDLAEPAPTLAFGHAAADWRFERPATTVLGDDRLHPPGHKVNADDIARLGEDEARARYGDRAGTEAMRLTIEQALVLQSFRPDYPVKGTKTKQFQQIGNAVPPLLAAHILAEILKTPST